MFLFVHINSCAKKKKYFEWWMDEAEQQSV